MREAVIVSAARTPIGRAFRGAFNQTHGATLAGPRRPARCGARRQVDPAEVEDVVIGVGLARRRDRQQHRPRRRVARRATDRRSRVRPSAATARRVCNRSPVAPSASSPTARRSMVAGGVESIRLVQNDMNMNNFTEEWLLRHEPDVYMPMLRPPTTSRRSTTSRAKRRTSTHSRASSAPRRRKPPGVSTRRSSRCHRGNTIADKDDGTFTEEHVLLKKDEGNRADTTLEGLPRSKAPFPASKRPPSPPAIDRSSLTEPRPSC